MKVGHMERVCFKKKRGNGWKLHYVDVDSPESDNNDDNAGHLFNFSSYCRDVNKSQ
jgi:hypothetical protein